MSLPHIPNPNRSIHPSSYSYGLTKREHFALTLAAAKMKQYGSFSPKDIVLYTDALLKELEK